MDVIAEPTRVRAVTFQVVSPVDGDWKALRQTLGEMWVQTTQAANWMIRELYMRDVRRNGQAKMPAMPKVYLYPEARIQFPELPPQTVVALEHAISRKYRSLRYKIIWQSALSLPNFRYPTPYPVHNQSWKAYLDEGNRPCVSVRLPHGENKRWELRLAGGRRYRRQLAAFRQLVDGVAKAGELAISKNHDGEIFVKLVGRFPAADGSSARTGVLRVHTDKDCLLVAADEKDERIWRLNFDHVKRWIAEYAVRLERLRQDRKAEERPHPSFEARQNDEVGKQRRRLDSAVKEAAAQLCHFALRRKFSAIRYNDAEKGFAMSFPWFQLRDRIRTKCQDLGLMFEHASAEVKPEEAGPLGEEKVR
jgi:hypothetical protein